MRSDFFHIQAEWGPREENAEACARRISRMLNELSDLHRVFTQMIVDPNWRLNRPSGALPSRATEIVPFLSPRRIYDWSQKRFIPDGYRLTASGAMARGRDVSLHIFAGVPGDDCRPAINQISISFNIVKNVDNDDHNGVGPAAVAPITLALVAAWEPQTASAVSTRYGELSRGAGSVPPFVHGIWTAYFAERAAMLSPTSLGVSRHLSDGGVLWCESDQSFDLDNPVHLDAAAAMHAALSAK
jgi:hypothetical protein